MVLWGPVGCEVFRKTLRTRLVLVDNQQMTPFLVASLAGALWLTAPQPATPPDTQELTRLERVWNEAHVNGDVAALDALCDEDLIVTVPEMAPMTKADILGFWRSGRARITRYDTSDARVQVYGDAAVVTGRLHRIRDFNGTVVEDRWRFTKTYVRRGQRWLVVSYHASVSR